MTVDLAERDDSRDRAVGVVLALTASSMLGTTLAFARVALGAGGVLPHVGFGVAVTVAYLFPSPGLSRRERSSSSVKASRERTAASGSGVGSEASASSSSVAVSAVNVSDVEVVSNRSHGAAREAAISERNVRTVSMTGATVALGVTPGRSLTSRITEGVFLPLGGRLGGGLIASLELALILRSTSPLLTALFAWHTLHAALAVATRDATTRRQLVRFAAFSWFALAVSVWGFA